MAAVLDITECPSTSLPQLLSATHMVARTVMTPGGLPSPRKPLLWPSHLDEIEAPHREAATLTPEVELYAVRDALVGGPGAHVVLPGGAYVWAAGAYPIYVRIWMENGITPEHWAVRAKPKRRLERAFVITHFNHVWGHWLTEIYPKLFLIRRLAAAGVRAPLLLPRNAPRFVTDVVRATLPGQRVIIYDPAEEAVSVDLLLMPDMMNRDYIFNDSLRQDLDFEAVRNARRDRGGGELIFVSRSRLERPSAYREMENAEALEVEAQRYGFVPVHPERLSWPEQIDMFAKASVIVGEFGSGMHNALMSVSNTRIVALNWIVDVQSRIANFRGHEIGYILPDDGIPRRFSIGQTLQPFSIDLGEFRSRLDAVLDGPAPPCRRPLRAAAASGRNRPLRWPWSRAAG